MILVRDAGDLPCVGPATSNYCTEEAGSGLLVVILTAGLSSPDFFSLKAAAAVVLGLTWALRRISSRKQEMCGDNQKQ